MKCNYCGEEHAHDLICDAMFKHHAYSVREQPMNTHDDLLARLEKYGAQRAKLAERLKDRMEPEWNHFIDAAAAIRSLQGQLSAALADVSGRSEMLLMMQDKYEAERKAREEAEMQRNLARRAEQDHKVRMAAVVAAEQRAIAAESRLAAVFEETRERCATIVAAAAPGFCGGTAETVLYTIADSIRALKLVRDRT